MHTARFLNWNGKTYEVSFRSKTTRWADMCKAAHAAILKAGYTTVQLLTVDDDPVEYTFAYR